MPSQISGSARPGMLGEPCARRRRVPRAGVAVRAPVLVGDLFPALLNGPDRVVGGFRQGRRSRHGCKQGQKDEVHEFHELFIAVGRP